MLLFSGTDVEFQAVRHLFEGRAVGGNGLHAAIVELSSPAPPEVPGITPGTGAAGADP